MYICTLSVSDISPILETILDLEKPCDGEKYENGESGSPLNITFIYRHSLARQPLLPKEGERVW